MLLKTFKQNMRIPNKEIFINKLVKIRDVDVLLISVSSEEHRNMLWAMYQCSRCLEDEMDTGEIKESITNRYEKINNINNNQSSNNLHISEIIIQEQKMIFPSSEASPIYENNYQGYMKLQHFIENGMDTSYWDDVDLSNVVIVAYQQEEGQKFPHIDLTKELDIILKINKEFKEILINKQMLLEFGETQEVIKHSFYDCIGKKDRFFYIDKLEHYDIREEVKNSFKHERMKEFSEEQRKQMEEQYMAHLDATCPIGLDLAMLEYETEDGVQLNFFTNEYLDTNQVHSSSSSIMFFKSDRKFGDNGFKSRLCMIKPVEKHFNGSISVELFSWHMEIPEEIIRV